ncbi:MAG: permease-like cell division protein FtsX [Lachnospiraceae bacterium]|nr:permease-like cell division protein FtsX [Lachnospiraceae bacterium]
MKLSSLMYHIQQGLKNIWRNKMFSLASIATMSACIFILGIFYSLGVNFQQMVKEAEKGVTVTIFFDEGIDQSKIDEIGKQISTRAEVDSYEYISPEVAWESFKTSYFEGDENIAASFNGDNPLINSANYKVVLTDVAKQASFVAFAEQLDGVREIKQSEVAASVLTDFNTLLAVVSSVIIAILILVAIFLINNTVTVGIAVRREEIAIMKLIGAKDSFVRAPFIVEGVVIGLIGATIPLILIFFVYHSVVSYVANQFNLLSNMLTFIPIGDVFAVLIPISVILGVGIGYLGSRFTLKKHLKV